MRRDRIVHLICALIGALASLIVIVDYGAGRGDRQPSPEPPAPVASTPELPPLPPAPSPEPHAEVVYRTPSGKRYHRATCGHVKGKGIELSLAEARERELTPCRVCNPPPLP